MSLEPGSTANPGYALGQLNRALHAAVTSSDPAVRARAAAKIGRWQAVLAGMTAGELTVGSRTPVRDTPAWVTLEVAHGGFATGRYLAEQPLDDAETARLAGLPRLPGRTDRERLNLWFLSDDGQAELLSALEQDRYKIELPEHAALPAVALLLARGHHEGALDLLAHLRPLLHRLRLAPTLLHASRPSSTLVHLESVGDVRRQLQHTTTPLQVQAMNATLSVWNPLLDDLLALWAETVEGELPHLLVGPEGPATVAGGWPCRRFPDDWATRRQELLTRHASAARDTSTPTRHLQRRSSTRRLVEALRTCPRDSSALTGRDVGWIRRVLADAVAAAGTPGSTGRASLRAQQKDMAARPTRRAVAQVLLTRLDAYPADSGVPDLDRVSAAVAPEELPGLIGAQPVPKSLLRKVQRALEAPVAQLVAAGVISSGDVLARVLPQVTAWHLAAGIADPAAEALYARTYVAFRRRRSLLLLDLQHQVRLGELPWVAALEAFREGGDQSTAAAASALREVVLLALTAFPQAILPNPLVRELEALSRRAGLKVPLVEEVAADIFMGSFTLKWRAAAEVASRTLDGTLYARYYDLPAATVWQQEAREPLRLRHRLRAAWKKETAEDFSALCRSRAREAGGPDRSPAGNGTVLEQSQVLTTHNLAVLVDALGLQTRLDQLAPALAEQVLAWIGRSWQGLPRERHAQLIAIKNIAYAWRQAVFLLSVCSTDEQRRQLAVFTEQMPPAAPGLAPVARGLEHILDGQRFDETGRAAGGGRRLLGWSVGPHWLLTREPEKGRPA